MAAQNSTLRSGKVYASRNPPIAPTDRIDFGFTGIPQSDASELNRILNQTFGLYPKEGNIEAEASFDVTLASHAIIHEGQDRIGFILTVKFHEPLLDMYSRNSAIQSFRTVFKNSRPEKLDRLLDGHNLVLWQYFMYISFFLSELYGTGRSSTAQQLTQNILQVYIYDPLIDKYTDTHGNDSSRSTMQQKFPDFPVPNRFSIGEPHAIIIAHPNPPPDLVEIILTGLRFTSSQFDVIDSHTTSSGNVIVKALAKMNHEYFASGEIGRDVQMLIEMGKFGNTMRGGNQVETYQNSKRNFDATKRMLERHKLGLGSPQWRRPSVWETLRRSNIYTPGELDETSLRNKPHLGLKEEGGTGTYLDYPEGRIIEATLFKSLPTPSAFPGVHAYFEGLKREANQAESVFHDSKRRNHGKMKERSQSELESDTAWKRKFDDLWRLREEEEEPLSMRYRRLKQRPRESFLAPAAPAKRSKKRKKKRARNKEGSS